jgi:hypothetical protein
MPIINSPATAPDFNSEPAITFRVPSFTDMDLDGGDSPWGGMLMSLIQNQLKDVD